MQYITKSPNNDLAGNSSNITAIWNNINSRAIILNPNNMEGDSYTYMPDAYNFKYFFLAVNFTSTEFVIMNVASMKVISYGDNPDFARPWITTDGTYVTITNPASWQIRVTMF